MGRESGGNGVAAGQWVRELPATVLTVAAMDAADPDEGPAAEALLRVFDAAAKDVAHALIAAERVWKSRSSSMNRSARPWPPSKQSTSTAAAQQVSQLGVCTWSASQPSSKRQFRGTAALLTAVYGLPVR